MPIVIGIANANLWIAGAGGGSTSTNYLLWQTPTGYLTIDATGGYILLQ